MSYQIARRRFNKATIRVGIAVIASHRPPQPILPSRRRTLRNKRSTRDRIPMARSVHLKHLLAVRITRSCSQLRCILCMLPVVCDPARSPCLLSLRLWCIPIPETACRNTSLLHANGPRGRSRRQKVIVHCGCGTG